MPKTVKHYTPGTPEFDAMCKTITPVEKIRSHVLNGGGPLIYAERDNAPSAKKTRKESVDKIR